MIGFDEVRWRMKCQEQETKLHQAFLDRVAEDIAELQRRHTATVAKIAEYRRKFLELEHRVLQVCHTCVFTSVCQSFIAVFTKAHQWDVTLSRLNPVQTPVYLCEIHLPK
jgi:hypothetical protein